MEEVGRCYSRGAREEQHGLKVWSCGWSGVVPFVVIGDLIRFDSYPANEMLLDQMMSGGLMRVAFNETLLDEMMRGAVGYWMRFGAF